MKMSIIEAYLDDLIKNSTLDVPAWNIDDPCYDRDMEDYRREKVP